MAATTIEKTAKKYKAAKLCGLVICVAGFYLALKSGENHWLFGFYVGMVLAPLGFLAIIGADVLAWWRHG